MGAVVEVHSDHFPHDIPDAEWLPVVGEREWVVLTNDKRIRYRRIERDALLAAGIRAFVLTVGHLSIAAATATWERHLRKIERLAVSTPAPFIAHVGPARVTIMRASRRR